MSAVHEIDMPPGELRFHRLSGRLCLDLVATIGERWRRRFERLRTPEDLDRWLRTVGLAASRPAGANDLRAARELRAAIELLAIAVMDGKRPPAAAVRTVNDFAARPDPAPRLHGERVVVRPAPVSAALSAVARDAVDLFGGPLRARVRECAADDCALVFVDASRTGARRWCSMRVCGNRSKVARHRGRQAEGTGT